MTRLFPSQHGPAPANPPEAQRTSIGLLLSGGLDSSILLAELLRQGRRVQPFYVRSHLIWEDAELRAVERFSCAMAERFPGRLEPQVVLDLPVDDLYHAHWSVTGRETPREGSPDEAVYLPGRNLLLLVKAAVWSRSHGIEEIALGLLRSNPFGDATASFFEQFQAVCTAALGGRLCFVRPFAHLSKQQVMALGQGLPLESTFSCIAPVDGLHCGRCNKCAERRAAFRAVGGADPTPYAYRLSLTP
jgi:7-cyano-7-deazaguanine synthase